MKKHQLIISFLLLFFYNINAQSLPKFIADSLDNYIERGTQNWEIPGVAVLIVKDGKIVFEKGYGVTELGTQNKVDKNTLFMIGSNTKAFTGSALALLEHEQKLKLDDKVIKYLPDFKMKDSWINNELNLQDIVSHRMGMETFQGDFIYWTSDLSSDEVIEKFGLLTPKYNFRTKYGYTNAGYAIAGKVIEKISNQTWGEFLKNKTFKPLEMENTVAYSQEFINCTNIAKPHSFVNNKMSLLDLQNIDNLAPAGSIGSSINDMSHWVLAQLDSGKFNGEKIIPFSVIQKTRQPLTIERRVKHPYNKTHYSLYGMGWGLQDYEGREIISHTGGVNGFLTSVTLMPEEKLGIVVLTNNDQNALFYSLRWEILDAFLNLPYRNYDSTYYAEELKDRNKMRIRLKEIQDSVKMNIKSEIGLSDFEGKYENEVYGFGELTKNENSLELKLEHHSKLIGKLEYIGNNRFFCTYSDPTYGKKVFQFYVKEGKVISFDLYVDNFVDYQPYNFVKIIE
ncbi:MAG: serine hydrolase [Ignavibacteriae bacterium]|nr:serine hydrolase [Ignavibacteriota bacterium]